MTRLLIRWILNALALLIVAKLVPGFHLSSFGSALIAALVFGFVNSTLGLFLKIITFPFAILTFGLFLLVINAVMLEFASAFVPGFQVNGFAAAFWGAVVLSVLHLIFHALSRGSERRA